MAFAATVVAGVAAFLLLQRYWQSGLAASSGPAQVPERSR